MESSTNPYEAPKSPPGPAEIGEIQESGAATTARYRLTTEDMRRFQAAAEPRIVKAFKVALVVLFGLTSLALITLLARIVLRTPRSRLGPTLFPLAQPLLVIVAVLAVMFVASRRRRSPGTSAEIEVELRPEGLLLRQEGLTETKHTWANVKEIRDNEHQILFIMRDLLPTNGLGIQTTAFIVPLRAFPTSEVAASFLGTARRWHSHAGSQGSVTAP